MAKLILKGPPILDTQQTYSSIFCLLIIILCSTIAHSQDVLVSDGTTFVPSTVFSTVTMLYDSVDYYDSSDIYDTASSEVLSEPFTTTSDLLSSIGTPSSSAFPQSSIQPKATVAKQLFHHYIINHYNIGSKAQYRDNNPLYHFNYHFNKGNTIKNVHKILISPTPVDKKDAHNLEPISVYEGENSTDFITSNDTDNSETIQYYPPLEGYGIPNISYAASNESSSIGQQHFIHHIHNYYNVDPHAIFEDNDPQVSLNFHFNKGKDIDNYFRLEKTYEIEEDGSGVGEPDSGVDTTSPKAWIEPTPGTKICPETFIHVKGRCLWVNKFLKLEMKAAEAFCDSYGLDLLHYKIWVKHDIRPVLTSYSEDYWLNYEEKKVCISFNYRHVKEANCDEEKLFICVFPLSYDEHENPEI